MQLHIWRCIWCTYLHKNTYCALWTFGTMRYCRSNSHWRGLFMSTNRLHHLCSTCWHTCMYMCTQQRDAKLAHIASRSHLQFMGGLDLMYVWVHRLWRHTHVRTDGHLMSYISLGPSYLAPRARTHSLSPHGLPVVVDPQFVQNNTTADGVGEGGQLALREVQLREGGEGPKSLGQCRKFVFAQVQILRNGTGKGRHKGICIYTSYDNTLATYVTVCQDLCSTIYTRWRLPCYYRHIAEPRATTQHMRAVNTLTCMHHLLRWDWLIIR